MKKLLAALFLLASFSVNAEPKLGTEYDQTIQQLPSSNPAKIEVMEIFWYGCPHCNDFDPLLNAWVKKLPVDVAFVRMPGLPQPQWAPMAKTFYAMEALGLGEKYHTALFDAIHKQKNLNPTDENAAIAWLTKLSGMEKKKVEDTFKSFSVSTKINRAAQIFRASGATGVPSLVIDGKYITSSTMTGGFDQALKAADYLIIKARAEKKSK